MPLWLILAGAATVAITALLTWVLWRINAPGLEAARREGEGADPTFAAMADRSGDGDGGGGK